MLRVLQRIFHVSVSVQIAALTGIIESLLTCLPVMADSLSTLKFTF